MKFRSRVLAVLTLVWLIVPQTPAAATSAGIVQSAPVPVLCFVTAGHVPTQEVLNPVLTAPILVTPGDTWGIRGLSVPGLVIPPNGTGSVTYAIVAGGTETFVSRNDFAPFDLDVPVSAPVGSIMEIRLVDYNTSEPVPQLGITFNKSCSREGRGIVARSTVGGAACSAASGSAGLSRGLLNVATLRQTMTTSLRATGCTAVESPTVRVTMNFTRVTDLTCSQGIPNTGIAGSGQIRWLALPPAGGVSHVSFTVYGTGLRDLLDIAGVIRDGPHAGESIAMTVARTPKTTCDGVIPLKHFTAVTVGAVLM